HVTLDLGGFVLSGTDTSQNAISVVPGRTDITIQNGAITSADAGIEASSATQVRIEALRVSKCGNVGISLGADSSVKNSSASENGAAGISVGLSSTVANCQAAANGANGIEAGQKCSVHDCNSARNAFSGVSVGDYSKVIGVTSADNSGYG